MLGFIAKLFIWWDVTTFGSMFTMWRRGARLIGTDGQGNRYFEEKSPSSAEGRRRRWVVYHGVAEASRVPSEWHGWLHHTQNEPPTVAPPVRRAWEKDHLPNMTGTPLAYHPTGSLETGAATPVAKEYEAWTPENA